MKHSMNPKMRVGFAITVVTLVLGGTALAAVQTVSVPAGAITERTTADGSTYYQIALDLPPTVQSVRHAWLHLRLDVSSTSVDGFQDPAPMLEVYGLKGELSRDPSPEALEKTRLPMSRPVAAGTNRLVKIDITEIVRAIVADPSTDYGVVVGSVTTASNGVFALQSGTVSIVVIDE